MYPSHPHLSLLTEQTSFTAYDEYSEFGQYDDAAAPAESFPASDWEPASPGDESWRLAALCAETDPEAFFPEKGGSTREAKKICTGCEVKAECLEYALSNDERFGIWGGLSERERRRLRRRAV